MVRTWEMKVKSFIRYGSSWHGIHSVGVRCGVAQKTNLCGPRPIFFTTCHELRSWKIWYKNQYSLRTMEGQTSAWMLSPGEKGGGVWHPWRKVGWWGWVKQASRMASFWRWCGHDALGKSHIGMWVEIKELYKVWLKFTWYVHFWTRYDVAQMTNPCQPRP